MASNFASTALAVALFAGASSVSATGGDAFEPIWVDSLKVQAAGTEGRSATRDYTISAGPDRAFLPDTIAFVEQSRSGGGRIEATFLEGQYTYANVDVTVDGKTYTLVMPQTIVVRLHAETGSGSKNYNRGAWLNGHVTAQTIEIDS